MKPNWLALLALPGTFALTLIAGSSLSAALQAATAPAAPDAPAPLTRQSFADRADGQIARLQQRAFDLQTDANAWGALGTAYLSKAEEAADAALYGRAEEAFGAALQQDQAAVEALTGMGQLALGRHQFTQALDWGLRAQAVAPSSPAVYGVLGDALLELGRFDEAVAAFQVMVDLRPDLASYARASYARELLGNIDGAIEAMTLAAKAGGMVGEPAAWARVHLGNLYWDYRGDAMVARGEYETALLAYPDYAAAHAGLARIAAGTGDMPAALSRATKAAEYQPTGEHLMLLADVLEASGRQGEADRQRGLIRAIEAAAIAGGADNALELAEMEADLGTSPLTTLEAARSAHARRPSARAAEVLAWAAFRAGEVAEAQTAISTPLSLGVRHPLTLYRGAAITAAAGDRSEALRLVEQALEANPRFSIRYAEDAARLRDALQKGVAQ